MSIWAFEPLDHVIGSPGGRAPFTFDGEENFGGLLSGPGVQITPPKSTLGDREEVHRSRHQEDRRGRTRRPGISELAMSHRPWDVTNRAIGRKTCFLRTGRSRLAAAGAVLSLMVGCGPLLSQHQGHYIIVHQEGYPLSESRQRVPPDRFLTDVWGPIQTAIDRYLATPGAPPRLLIHVHGGMTTYQQGLRHMDRFIAAQGLPTHPHLKDHFLLFVNWDSSFVTSLLDDLFVVRLGERNLPPGVPSAPFITGARLAQSAFLAPQSWGLQLVNIAEGVDVDDEGSWHECAPPAEGPIGTGWVGPSLATFIAFYPVRALSVPLIHGFGAPVPGT